MSCIFSRFAERVRNATGQPGQGMHAWHIGPFAVIDLVLTIIAVYILWYFFSYNRCPGSYLFWLLFALVLATITHLIFGVETGVIKSLRNLGILNSKS